MLFLPHVANSIRQRVNLLRKNYQTVENAESKLGLNIDNYMGKDSPSSCKRKTPIRRRNEEMDDVLV